jgi:hypothetical protein
MPDGEIGRTWITSVIEEFRGHPDLEVLADGSWTSYTDRLEFVVRGGHVLDPATLDPGIARAARQSYPQLSALKAEGLVGEDVPFQVGISTDFALAMYTLTVARRPFNGPLREGMSFLAGLKYRKLFQAVLVREMATIMADTDGDVIFQLELPAELVMLSMLPPPLRQAAASAFVRSITGLVRAAPAGARFGIHMCMGDLNHQPLQMLRSLNAVVLLAMMLLKTWPEDHSLEFLHVPLATGAAPPVVSREFVQPLRRLVLPSSVRFFAGLGHEDQPLERQREVLRNVDDALGFEAGVAYFCGAGRLDEATAVDVLRKLVALSGT